MKMQGSDEKLDQLLKSANPVSPRIDLAQRIITKADPYYHSHVQLEQSLHAGEENIFKQVMRRFIFPRPVYALTFSMLVGLLLGWQTLELVNTSADINFQLSSVEDDISSLFLSEVSYYE